MFDSVGRDLDEEATRRSAKAGAIAFGLTAFVAGMTVAAGMWVVREVVIEQLQEDIVEVAMEEEAQMEAPPPPPPPPPPPAAASAEEEQEEPDDPTPDEMTEQIEELKEEVKTEMKSDVKPAGVVGGVEGGVAGGVVGGVIGGVEGGVLGGELGGGAKVVHHSEIQWKRKIEPVYPVAARGLGLGDQKCKVTLKLDEEGVPYNIQISGCPEAFHETTKEALMKWRAYPFKVGKDAIKVQATIIVNYREVG